LKRAGIAESPGPQEKQNYRGTDSTDDSETTHTIIASSVIRSVLSSTLCVIFASFALFAVNCFEGSLPQSTQRAAKVRKEIRQIRTLVIRLIWI
jgi:hypothetical protein